MFGYMLSNAGYRLDFVVEMSVQQDRCDQRGYLHPSKFPRQDKGLAPDDKSHAVEARFSVRKRTEFTPDLVALRKGMKRGETFPLPDPNMDYRDWYDGSAIRGAEMTSQERERRARSLS